MLRPSTRPIKGTPVGIATNLTPVGLAWHQHAPALAAWANANLVNRRDAYGQYVPIEARKDGNDASTAKRELTLKTLQRHFEGASTGDLIGLHAIEISDGRCFSRWLGIDIDRHDDSTNPDATFAAALSLFDRLVSLGFKPLLLDSNGRGGYHLIVMFSERCPTSTVYAFGKWLVRDWKALGLDSDPEVFPKQPSVPSGGFGNWLRLPGRHHTRDHYTRSWKAGEWLEGSDAIKFMIGSGGTSPTCIPAEALEPTPKPKGKAKAASGSNDAELASQALDYLDPSMSYKDWLEIGMALTPLGREGLDLWNNWSAGSDKYRENDCDRKWRSFVRTGVTLGTLFHLAKTRGFEFPKGKAPEKPAEKPNLKVVRADPSTKKPEPPAERRQIEVSTQQHEVVEESIEALRSDPDLYRRGDELVMVIREDNDLVHLTTQTTLRNTKGSPKLITIAESVIGERLTRVAEYFAWRTDRNGEPISKPVLPPPWLVANISRRKHWPGIRPLVAVAECPFPRPDGSMVETPGYDAETAILYTPSMDFTTIPKRPSRDDARAAWRRLRHHFRFYPFPTEDDAVVVLAGMLNVIARHGIIGPMPGIAINGNKAGIGKGFLVDAMVIPGTGRVAPTSKYPHDPAEAGKVKTSIVASGKTVVSFDNLGDGTRYGGEDIDSLLTAKVIDDRILGSSKNTGELIVRLTCFVNGNNIEPVRDAYRRWLVCNLVTDHEHPERREDLMDEQGNARPTPDTAMIEDRRNVVIDLLTILRAHAIAGRPNGGWPALGSFEHWDKVVRGAVWFATDRDCTSTQQRAAEDSQDTRDKLALLEGLRELPGAKYGERGVTSVDAVAFVEGNPGLYHVLRNALIQRGQKGKPADSRMLGIILRGMVNSRVGNLKLLRHPILKHGAAAWVIDCIEGKTRGEDGEDGEDVSTTYVGVSDSNSDVITSRGICDSVGLAVKTASPSSPSYPQSGDPDFDWASGVLRITRQRHHNREP